MAAEEDVPLRDAARHYEQKFGDKLRQVRKGGARPPAGGGGSGAGRGAVAGAIILTVIVVRLLIGFAGSSSRRSTPSHTFTPPPRIDFDQQRKAFEDLADLQREMDERRFGRPPVVPALPGEGPAPSYRFEEGDVPLPEGLCYRIEQEAGAAGAFNPGKRVTRLLDSAAREMVRRAARGEALPRVELDELRAALNELLDRRDFYSPAHFLDLRLPPEVTATRDRLEAQVVPVPAEEVRQMNRLALEAAYPAQIVPARARGEKRRRVNAESALWDLQEARRKYGALKP